MPGEPAKDRRLWAKLSVDYFDNPKIDSLSDAAQLLHLQLILRAKAQGRGGVVSARACKARGMGPFRELVEADLLDEIETGKWSIHDYEKHQSDAADLSEKRTASGALGNHTRHHVKKVVFDNACEHCQNDADLRKPWTLDERLRIKPT